MANFKFITSSSLIAIFAASLVACGGGGSSSNNNPTPPPPPPPTPPAPVAKMDASATNDGTNITNTAPDGTVVTTATPGASYTTTALGTTEGLTVSQNGQGVSIYDPSTNNIGWQSFGVITDATSSQAYASQDLSTMRTVAPGTPAGSVNWSNVNYAYAIGSAGSAVPAPVTGSTGVFTADLSQGNFSGSFGPDVTFSGKVNGTALDGTVNVNSVSNDSGKLTGYIGSNVAGGAATQAGGVFYGENADQSTSYAGAFYR